MYKSGIQVTEQALRLAEAKSRDDYRRTVEEVWKKLVAIYKDQAEAQAREFQKGVDKWLEVVTTAKV
jgi:hypothetical protein